MRVFRGNGPWPELAGPTVVTIGVFDGVHLGHRAVLSRAVDVGRQLGRPAVAVTFDPHPREVLTPGQAPPLLTTARRKAALIDELGLDAMVVLRFDDALSRLPAEEFARRVVSEGLRAERVVVGANFTFGHQALGTVDTLRGLGHELAFEVESIPLAEVQGRRVSSSSIRAAVAEGDLAWPTAALGRRFTVDGQVVAGAGRGAGLGFPTANLEVPPRMLLPARGVYAGRAILEDGGILRSNRAAINVGTNPQFGWEALHVEAFLLDFDEDLRRREITVEFWERLRDEVRFDSVEDLVRQIGSDVERTRALIPGG
jgi:riboflavin kinase / FMN adenylyltransferase